MAPPLTVCNPNIPPATYLCVHLACLPFLSIISSLRPVLISGHYPHLRSFDFSSQDHVCQCCRYAGGQSAERVIQVRVSAYEIRFLNWLATILSCLYEFDWLSNVFCLIQLFYLAIVKNCAENGQWPAVISYSAGHAVGPDSALAEGRPEEPASEQLQSRWNVGEAILQDACSEGTEMCCALRRVSLHCAFHAVQG